MNNYSKVITVFLRNYKEIPLEVFKQNPYKVLISTILSSRTKDETTLASSQRLFHKAVNFKMLDKLSVPTIKNLIYPVGFYNTKAEHLKQLAKIILEKYGGKIPNSRSELKKLPGVGQKTANLVLNRAFNTPAIAVDTHVHRISNMLGWVQTNTPEKTEQKLIEILPKKYWSRVNKLFVSIGRQYTTRKKLERFLKKEKLI